MQTSEARILANKANAQHSTGPKTVEGKANSRCNAFKHGLTGEGVAMSIEDAAEVEQLFEEISSELKPSGPTGRVLVRRLATLAIRLDRCVAQETAAISDHVRQAKIDFIAPEGMDDDTIEQLRAEAGHRALFDPSKEATLARKYEAAAERGFFRSLKEFREVERKSRENSSTTEPGAALKALGSFSPIETMTSILKSLPPLPSPSTAPKPSKPSSTASIPVVGGSFHVPISIGKPR
jgi:hypothetical protein